VTEVGGPVYVYGVVLAPWQGAISTPGIDGSRVDSVEHAGLVALISPLQGDELAAPPGLRTHWRVLQEASEQTTVVPIRFGTAMESEDAVRERLLKPNSEQLSDLLRRLTGLVQLNVKGGYDEETLLREIVRDSRAIATLRERLRSLPQGAAQPERMRLGELVAGEVTRWRERDTLLALRTLEPLAVDARSEPTTETWGAFDLAFLVDGRDRDRFDREVGRLKQAMRDRVEIGYIGPLPPYSFAETNLSQEAAAWA
jgi:hypothetical protein